MIEFTDKTGPRTATVVDPTAKVKRDAREYASRAKVVAMRKKEALTQEELDKFLRDSGIVTDEDEEVIKENSKKIAELINKLEKGGYKASEAKEDARSLLSLRIETINLLNKDHPYQYMTYEAIEKQAEFDFLVSKCVLDEAGKPFYKTVEDYLDNGEGEWVEKACAELQKRVYNTEKNPFENLIEFKVLRKFGVIDEEGNFKEEKKQEEATEPQPFLGDDGNPIE